MKSYTGGLWEGEVTVDNCRELSNQYQQEGCPSGEAAWRVVFNFCLQHGMNNYKSDKLTGIERVIEYMQRLIDKS